VLSRNYFIREVEKNNFSVAYEDGVNLVYLSNGQGLKTKLNDVDWESYVISLGVVYRF
jgi:hypothetical protein